MRWGVTRLLVFLKMVLVVQMPLDAVLLRCENIVTIVGAFVIRVLTPKCESAYVCDVKERV